MCETWQQLVLKSLDVHEVSAAQHSAWLERVMQSLGFAQAQTVAVLEGAGVVEHGRARCADFVDYLTDEYIGHKYRAASVHHLATSLFEEMEACGHSREAKVYEIESSVIRPRGEFVRCPRDGRLGAAYIDSVFGADKAGPGGFMLSYTWGYGVGDIVDTLVAFCSDRDLDQKRTYVWTCCLCINQHRVKEAQAKGEAVPFTEFEKAFGERVSGLGHVIAMMSPWNDPIYISRVWCAFEMFTAVCVEKTTVSIVMPPREAEGLRATLLDGSGLDAIWQVLAGLDVAEANAFMPEDRTQILAMIRAGPGFHNMNMQISEHLQSWILDNSEGHLLRGLETGEVSGGMATKLCNQVGRLLVDLGQLERGGRLLDRALMVHEEMGTLESYEGAALLSDLGRLMDKRGDLDGALATYARARELHNTAGTLQSLEGAKLLSRLGKTMGERGDLKGKLELYMEARSIQEAVGSLETADGAELLSSIAAAKRQSGDTVGALEVYSEALAVRRRTDTLQSPGGAKLLSNIGYAKVSQKDVEGALEAYREARLIRERTGTLESSEGATLLANMAACCDVEDGELPLLLEARRIREKTGTLETQLGSVMMSNIARIQLASGDVDQAVDAYVQAKNIREQTGTLHSKGGFIVLAKLGDALEKQGKLEEALREFRASRQMREDLGALEADAGARLCENIGDAELKRGSPEAAVEAWEEALRIYGLPAAAKGRKKADKASANEAITRLQEHISRTGAAGPAGHSLE